MTDKALISARAAASRFAAALDEADQFSEDLAHEYERVKRALAAQFQDLSLMVLPRDQYRLDDVKAAVVARMRLLFEGRVDSEFFRIRGYTTPHPDLYALLASNVGSNIPGWRIRLLSGDKIHTERRTRELRDFGLKIDVNDQEDSAFYCLTSLEPDLTYGAAFQLRENAIKAQKTSRDTKAYLVEIAEAAAQLPERKTSL